MQPWSFDAFFNQLFVIKNLFQPFIETPTLPVKVSEKQNKKSDETWVTWINPDKRKENMLLWLMLSTIINYIS